MHGDRLISIIVPIYNSEKYLFECLNSLINQTYKKIEIILIDDGSTDNSYKIYNNFAIKDSRIKIYKQENRGVSAARNLGINKAKGDFLLFIDSDDSVHHKMVENMYINLVKYNADICACGYILKDEEGKEIRRSQPLKKTELDKFEAIKYSLHKEYYQGFMWNKMFSTKLIKENKIKLNESIHVYEDLLFLCECILYSNKFIFINEHYYYYTNRIDSTLNSDFNHKKLTIFSATSNIYNICIKFNKNLIDDLNKMKLYANYYLLQNMVKSKYKNKWVLNNIQNEIIEVYRSLKSRGKLYLLNGKEKIFLYITKFNPIITYYLLNILYR